MVNGLQTVLSIYFIMNTFLLARAEENVVGRAGDSASSPIILDSIRPTPPSISRQELEAQFVHHFADVIKTNGGNTMCTIQWQAIQILNGYSKTGIPSMCMAAYDVARAHPPPESTSSSPPPAQLFSYRLIFGRLYLDSSSQAKDANLWTDVVKCEIVDSETIYLIKGRCKNCAYFAKPTSMLLKTDWTDVLNEFILDENYSSDVELAYKFTEAAIIVGSEMKPHIIQLLRSLQML